MDVWDAPPRLIVITDTTAAPRAEVEGRLERILAFAPARSVLVQLRDPELSFRERMALGEVLAAACDRHRQWFGVNDRADLAVLLGARALHLGERSVDTADARRLMPRAWVSRACHDPDAVAAADADAVLLSPVVQARKGRGALGMEGLRRARAAIGASGPRLYALGGVDATTARACLDAGADGIAVIGAALDTDDPRPLLNAVL